MIILNKLIQSLLLSCLLAVPSKAADSNLKLVTDDGPPHIIQSRNSGLDIDTVRAILAEAGYTFQIEYMSLARANRAVKSGMADVVVPTFFEQDNNSYYISDPVVDYRPMVFSLKNNGYQFNSFEDITDLRVMTFQGAVGYFGEKFREVTKQNYYTEIEDMTALPRLLARNRADVVVLDQYIFTYHWKQIQSGGASSMYQIHDFMPAIPAFAGFKDKHVRDEFNQALRRLNEENQLDSIREKYK